MKKLLGISLVAVLAATPLMANAADVAKVGGALNDQNQYVVTANTNVATTSYVAGAYNALADEINADRGAINILNGDAETAGSVAKAIVDERSETATLTNKTIDADDNTIADLETDNFKTGVIVDSTTGIASTLSGASDEKLVTEKAVKSAIDSINSDASTLAGRVTTAEGKLNTLQGDASTAGSVAYAVAAEATARNTAITDAVEALDATESQTAGADGLALSITEVDGVITSISGSIAANTYDSYGSAAAAQSAAEATAAADATSKANAAQAAAIAHANQRILNVYGSWATPTTATGTTSLINTPEEPSEQSGN